MQDDQWWRGAVIYQIYPRSFHDSDGDGVGDLAGVVEKLDYVASLGVDAIWLSPFFLSPMRDFGYDVADHCAVDPVFGTLADFDRLLERAHTLGIKVIIDLVCGHTSDAHPWFRASRAAREGAQADWYVWADARADGTPPNNWLSVFGGSAWSWEPRRRQYYLHHFLSSQPALNLRNPAAVDALLAAARFWLGRGIDGFRVDAVDFLLHDQALRDNPPRPPAGGVMPVKPFGLQHHVHDMMQPEVTALLRRFRELADRHPGTALVGEVSSQDGAYARIQRYTAPGEGLHMAYTLRPLRGEDVATALKEALAELADTKEQGWMCWAFSNHDVERAVSRWNPGRRHGAPPDPAFARLLLALLVGLRGSVCLYQGEELGLTEAALDYADLRDPFGIAYFPEFRGRDGSRTPMPWRPGAPHAGFTSAARPWLPLPEEHRSTNVATQEADRASPLHAWRRLLAWRRAHPALVHGSLRSLALPAPLIGFEREHEGERLLALFNTSDRPTRLSLGPHVAVTPLEGHGFDAVTDGEVALLPPYGVFFAVLETAAAARQDEVKVAAV